MQAQPSAPAALTLRQLLAHPDGRWLGGAVALSLALALASQWRLGSLAGFENLPPHAQAAWVDIALAFAQFPAMGWLGMRVFKFGLSAAGVRRFPNIARHLLGVLVHAIMLALAVRTVFDQSLDTVVAASGVITVVLGFALRSLVADLFSGIALSVDRDIGVDDIVEFNLKNRHVVGQIVEFNWRTFKIRDLNNQVMMIPNSEFSSLMVVNHSRSDAGCPCSVRFPLHARTDGERALRVIRGALNREVEEGRIAAKPEPHVEIAAAAPGSLALEVYFLPQPPHTEQRVVGAMYEAGLRDLRLAGMALAGAGDGPSGAATSATAEQVQAALAQAVGRVALLSVLTEAQRLQVVPHLIRHEPTEGATIVDEGDEGSSLFIILEGACEVKVRSGSDWRHVARLWPGDHFGEMSLLTGNPRSARVSMAAPGVLLELPKQALSELFDASPDLLAKISASVVARSEQADAVRKQVRLEAREANGSRVDALVQQMKRFFGLARR
ncbi:MAG: mechanosensitive ion channel family protein [Burkholderiales bacterium]|nr:mechanosensitive ion channel family protein [Burkholderiales bacterium]